MAIIVGNLAGKNKTRDYQIQALVSNITTQGVISGLSITNGILEVGTAIIEVTRTGVGAFKIPVFITEPINLTLANSKKIYINIAQDNIDDGDTYNTDTAGVGIATIEIQDTFPNKNFVKLAETDGAGVVTDLRKIVNIKSNSGIIETETTLEIKNQAGMKQKIKADIEGNTNVSGEVTATKFIGDGSQLTGISAEIPSTSLNYMLGSAGSISKAYSQINYEQLIGTTANDVGSIAQPLVSQSFYGQTDISSITLMVATVSSPSDDILIEIQGDNAGVPNGTVIGTSDVINNIVLTSTLSETDFTFSTPVPITEGVLYHIVLKRSGVNDALNHYSIGSAGADSQIGTMSVNNGTTWANQTDDLYFKLTGYKLAVLGGTNFIGICQSNGNIGEIGKFNKDYDNNQTGLIVGEYYSYDELTGNIIAGDKFKAISETELSYSLWSENINEIKLQVGENIEKGNTVRYGMGTKTSDYDSIFTNEQVYGLDNARKEIVQSFTPAEDTILVNFTMWDRNNDNTGTGSWRDVYMNIYSDITCTNLIKSCGVQRNSGLTAVRLTFDCGGIELTGGIQYFAKFHTQNVSTIYYHFCQYNTGNPHTGGTAYIRDSSGVLTDLGGDLRFALNFGITEEDKDKIYKTIANNSYKTKFIGFAEETKLMGQYVNVSTTGITKILSGLTPNTIYYLTDIAGGVGTTPGTNEIKVAKSLTSTELLILQKSSKSDIIRISLSSSTTVIISHNLGYIPTDITCFAVIQGSSLNWYGSAGGWRKGESGCSYNAVNSGGTAGLLYYTSLSTNANYQLQGVITSVTDREIIITHTRGTSASNTIGLTLILK